MLGWRGRDWRGGWVEAEGLQGQPQGAWIPWEISYGKHPRVGSRVFLVGDGEDRRCWNEALEPFLDIWGLADTGGNAGAEEGMAGSRGNGGIWGAKRGPDFGMGLGVGEVPSQRRKKGHGGEAILRVVGVVGGGQGRGLGRIGPPGSSLGLFYWHYQAFLCPGLASPSLLFFPRP